MVILRGCARCGGDVLTGDRRNVRCLQCGHRPALQVAELRRRAGGVRRRRVEMPVDVEEILAALEAVGEELDDAEDGGHGGPDARCPRCDDADAIALEKLRAHFNTVFRCRVCEHIFSPGGSHGGRTAELWEAS